MANTSCVYIIAKDSVAFNHLDLEHSQPTVAWMIYQETNKSALLLFLIFIVSVAGYVETPPDIIVTVEVSDAQALLDAFCRLQRHSDFIHRFI
jgi:hypothetical protein